MDGHFCIWNVSVSKISTHVLYARYKYKRLGETLNHCNTKHGKQRSRTLQFEMDRYDISKITSTEQ